MSASRPRVCALGVAPGEASPRATVRRLAGPRVVAYHPSFAAIGGSINAGLFLAQLFYWHDRGSDPDGWIYKTQAEWEEETGLTRWQQEAARQLLRERGLVEERLAGLPARLYYRLDVERLVALLSARVERVASRGTTLGESRPRVTAQPVATPRASPRERHSQDCGSATNKDVGNPQTSSRDFHTHAETTNRDHSREKRTERLAAGSLADSLGESFEPSSAGSDEAVSVTAVEPYPSERVCSLHGVPMRLRRKDGDHWYSHRLRDGTWCKGAPGDQPDDGRPAKADPQSIESRREYLGWVDPDALRRLPGAPRPVDYGAYCAGAYRETTDDTTASRAGLRGAGACDPARAAPRPGLVASPSHADTPLERDQGGGRAPPPASVSPSTPHSPSPVARMAQVPTTRDGANPQRCRPGRNGAGRSAVERSRLSPASHPSHPQHGRLSSEIAGGARPDRGAVEHPRTRDSRAQPLHVPPWPTDRPSVNPLPTRAPVRTSRATSTDLPRATSRDLLGQSATAKPPAQLRGVADRDWAAPHHHGLAARAPPR